MAFAPKEFLSFADKLMASSERPEALIRTAISRAYYAAFLEARERVRRIYPQDFVKLQRPADVHALVRDLLKRKGQFSLSDKLFSLFLERGHADYDLTPPLDDLVRAEKATKLSQDIFARLQKVQFFT